MNEAFLYTYTTSFVFSTLCCDEDYNLEREKEKGFFSKRQKGEEQIAWLNFWQKYEGFS